MFDVFLRFDSFWMFVCVMAAFGAAVLRELTWKDVITRKFFRSLSHRCFVRFYSSKCLFSRFSEAEFLQAADQFRTFEFWNVDCERFGYVCRRCNVIGTPSFVLYNSTSNVVFTGQRNALSMIRFIETETNYLVRPANGPFFDELNDVGAISRDSSACKVFVEYLPGHRLSRRHVKLMQREVAPVFAGDDVHFYTVNLFLIPFSTEPCLRVLYNGTAKTVGAYEWEKDEIVRVIAESCQLARLPNGSLPSNLAFNGEEVPTFAQIMATKATENEFYANISARVRRLGPSILHQLLNITTTLYETAPMSPRKRSDLQLRINILASAITSLQKK